ncbi:hypothetical protein Poli38472_008579 [Pythium oligandrum]|uniref:Maspardin n=1 Tax=Pythium oligandrum TaxID=41045 RepID=A0A8K1C3T4_PYTOL|nr:hypothetical protein Poli38472_008579 [Pythium oligandrum]|eukprot:TMW55931.1 hypothetical protein Poli38472_008579 [Pythium oligandrum]
MLATTESAFRQSVARQRVTTYDGNTWEYYDCGKHTAKNAGVLPLVCLPGTSGSATCFHLQMTALAEKGYRVLAVQYPVVWTHEEWIHSFDRFLDALHLTQIHVYGVSLGAYLAQRYSALYPHRIASLAMTQGFSDTSVFGSNAPYLRMLPYMPEFYLKKYILEGFPSQKLRSAARREAIDYMVEQLDRLAQQDIASRLTLNCLPCDPNSWRIAIADDKITIIDSIDETSLPAQLRDQLMQRYPAAKLAMLKDAGDFPFLSHHEEVSMHLQVHLRANGVFIS